MTGWDLRGEARDLDEATFSELRSHAFACGTVIERDGCSILAFGRADVIDLPNGLRDPVALEEVTERLAALSPEGGAGSGLRRSWGRCRFSRIGRESWSSPRSP